MYKIKVIEKGHNGQRSDSCCPPGFSDPDCSCRIATPDTIKILSELYATKEESEKQAENYRLNNAIGVTRMKSNAKIFEVIADE